MRWTCSVFWICVAFVVKEVTVVSCSGAGVAMKPNDCNAVKSKCIGRVGCGMALHNFFLGCNAVIYGDTTECTVQCTRALISLLSTEDKVGLAFTDCDCDGDQFCETRKQRVEVCSVSVLEAIKTLNDTSVVSCNLARWLCEADSSCQTALSYYFNHCESLLEGITCSARCNNSLSILYRQVKAAKLINCSCEGTEEVECLKLRHNTEKLCFKRDSGYQIHHQKTNLGTRRILDMLTMALFSLYHVLL